MLVTGKIMSKVDVVTPSGARLNLDLVDQRLRRGWAECAVIKDSGDDPDVTNRVKIFAKAKYSRVDGINVKGSRGVGVVTKPGLAVRVGDWAINPVPRKMIIREALAIKPKNKGLEITIRVPDGKALAKRTFNPKLGIVGGISIIGTTGIVVPKSLDAYRRSLALELNVLKAQGCKRAVLVLGYVGDKYAKEILNIDSDQIVKIGDHVGYILKHCAKIDLREVLLVGHISKLAKITAGQFNTNYKFGDNRTSSMARYAKLCGANSVVAEKISGQITAEAAITVIESVGLNGVFSRIALEVSRACEKFADNKINVKCILLSLEGKVLAGS